MEDLQTIKNWLEQADCLIINTGAGMGVDSGLADYRGNGGQWGEVESETGQDVFETVNPKAFLDNPAFSWKFFGKRMKEYAEAEPHAGFGILKKWTEVFCPDYFCLTSNIDGHLQKAGFAPERIREMHGSLAYFQTSRPDLSPELWENRLSGAQIISDAEKGIFPTVPGSEIPARPNVYMFRDDTYISQRTEEQKARFQEFTDRNEGKNMLVFEIGSGPHVQTIRQKTRMLRTKFGAKIVRINPKDFRCKPPHIGLAKGALAALTEINNLLDI